MVLLVVVGERSTPHTIPTPALPLKGREKSAVVTPPG
jgi:hypothetical protein